MTKCDQNLDFNFSWIMEEYFNFAVCAFAKINKDALIILQTRKMRKKKVHSMVKRPSGKRVKIWRVWCCAGDQASQINSDNAP